MTELLSDTLKDKIQDAYRAWLGARGFRARRGQREMIAHIARTLTAVAAADAQQATERVALIEAGTGTGKTAAYCIAAIPIAAALGKRVVISSATVALQEQVVLRDIPDLQARTGLQFGFQLAKGRGRYLCLKRLDDTLKADGPRDIPLFELPGDDYEGLFNRMLVEFGSGAWDGELDSWSDGVPEEAWRAVTTDHRGCTNSRCGFFRQCPFFKARGGLDKADVIVANHDLVLADLALGGGAVLPEPEDVIYIFDEAHHLPLKAQNHFSARARVRGSVSWLDTLNSTIGTLTQRFARPAELVAVSQQLADVAPAVAERLSAFTPVLEALSFSERDERLETHRFTLGDVGAELKTLASEAHLAFVPVPQLLAHVGEMLQEVVDGKRDWQPAFEAEDWLPAVGTLEARADALQALLADYATGAQQPLYARWVNRADEDLELVSAPVDTGALLGDTLFARAFGVICTSATLTALGRFDRFLAQTGLDGRVTQVRIPSPFDYPNIAELHVPALESDPRDPDAHSLEVAARLPALLAAYPSALVLFASWRQLNRVRDALPDELTQHMAFQGDAARQTLLEAHRAAIDAGRPSYLAGLASFAEGVDLPNDYCRHVIIAKLPFAVPDDPLSQAAAEWVEHQGRNAFYEISVPDAALKLVQACGRLIRNENDHGRITLLDRRIATQRYGRALLDSLPPYKRIIE